MGTTRDFLHELRSYGVERLAVLFSGEGDSGDVTDTVPTPAVDLPTSVLDEAMERTLMALPPGWENNEGASGEVVFDVSSMTAALRIRARFMEQQTEIVDTVPVAITELRPLPPEGLRHHWPWSRGTPAELTMELIRLFYYEMSHQHPNPYALRLIRVFSPDLFTRLANRVTYGAGYTIRSATRPARPSSYNYSFLRPTPRPRRPPVTLEKSDLLLAAQEWWPLVPTRLDRDNAPAGLLTLAQVVGAGRLEYELSENGWGGALFGTDGEVWNMAALGLLNAELPASLDEYLEFSTGPDQDLVIRLDVESPSSGVLEYGQSWWELVDGPIEEELLYLD